MVWRAGGFDLGEGRAAEGQPKPALSFGCWGKGDVLALAFLCLVGYIPCPASYAVSLDVVDVFVIFLA